MGPDPSNPSRVPTLPFISFLYLLSVFLLLLSFQRHSPLQLYFLYQMRGKAADRVNARSKKYWGSICGRRGLAYRSKVSPAFGALRLRRTFDKLVNMACTVHCYIPISCPPASQFDHLNSRRQCSCSISILIARKCRIWYRHLDDRSPVKSQA